MTRLPPIARWACLAALVALPVASSCSKQGEVIIETAAGKELTADDIDRDPVALLPGNAIGVAYLDTQQMYASQFGQKLLDISRRRVPIPATAGYDPQRDLMRLYVGVYSMQGADVAGVAVGNFDREKIQQAADTQQTTPLGVPISKSTYADRTLYTANEVGFVVLTAHTVLFGNITGMRRSLDRIKQGRVQHDVPAWLETMMRDGKAPLIVGLNLESQPISDALRSQAPFLNGLKSAGILGNFQPPGVNLAATMKYDDEAGAQRGAQAMVTMYQNLQSYSFWMSLVGISQPIRRLEAVPSGTEVKAVIELDAAAVNQLLDMADRSLPGAVAR